MTTPILRTFRIGDLQVSECPEPGVVELLIPDGTCRMTREQWQQLGDLTADFCTYNTDFVRFVEPPAQAELPLSAPGDTQ